MSAPPSMQATAAASVFSPSVRTQPSGMPSRASKASACSSVGRLRLGVLASRSSSSSRAWEAISVSQVRERW